MKSAGAASSYHDIVTRVYAALDRDGILGTDDLPFGEPERNEDRIIDQARRGSLSLAELEKEYIIEVLAECSGSRKNTASVFNRAKYAFDAQDFWTCIELVRQAVDIAPGSAKKFGARCGQH